MQRFIAFITVIAGLISSLSVQAQSLVQYNYVLSYNYQTRKVGELGLGYIEISTCGHKLRMDDLKFVETKLLREFSALRVVFLGSIPLEETTCKP